MGILNALGGNDIGVKGDISPNYVIPGVVAFWIIGTVSRLIDPIRQDGREF